MTAKDLRMVVITIYMDAFYKGTDKAWKVYRKKLAKLAKENNASSPEALENWALNIW